MKTRGTEREKADQRQAFHPTPALGSPMQTAVCNMAAFSLFIKVSSGFECSFFENRILGEFSELVCNKTRGSLPNLL